MSHQGGQYRRGVAQLVEHVLFAPSIEIFSVLTTILVMGLSLIPVYAGWYSLLSTESNKGERMSKKSVEKKLKGGFFSFSQKVPSGITLTSEETKEVIELWKEDVEVIKTNTEKLSSADTAIERNLTRLPESLSQVSNARNDAIRYFKITKDPIKRREWARRLIVADNAHKSIKASQDRMNVKPAELVTDAQNSVQTKSTVFTVFWVILVLAELDGLGYAVFRDEDF